jgi:hypothetical protein
MQSENVLQRKEGRKEGRKEERKDAECITCRLAATCSSEQRFM